MRRPGLTVANRFANGRKCLTELIFALHWHGLLALGSSARRPMPHTGSLGQIQLEACCQSSKSDFFMAGFCVNLT